MEITGTVSEEDVACATLLLMPLMASRNEMENNALDSSTATNNGVHRHSFVVFLPKISIWFSSNFVRLLCLFHSVLFLALLMILLQILSGLATTAFYHSMLVCVISLNSNLWLALTLISTQYPISPSGVPILIQQVQIAVNLIVYFYLFYSVSLCLWY